MIKSRGRRLRRGVAIIVVLTMVSIALAISYAMLRTQTTSSQVQSNSDRREQSRGAAMAGLAASIRKMHQNSWSGVGTTMTGSVDGNDSYSVTFTAGDDSLTQASPNYVEWHRRVTVTSIGTSVNPANSQVSSTHVVKAVLELVPLALGAQPTNWSQVQSYTLYQTSNGQFTMQVPGRVEGPVRLQGAVQLGNGLNWSSSARTRHTSDLNVMRTARNEVQTVTLSALGGTFRLTFNEATTGTLNYNASAATVQTALRALSTIGGTNVSVTGNYGGPYTVTFQGALGNQNVAQMTAHDGFLWGLLSDVDVDLITQGSGGYADCRPLTGPVSLPTSATDATNLALLASLGVTTNNIPVSTAMSPTLPNSLATYRIYTGGPMYNVPQVSSNLINTTLAPDPVTNPLGIYFCGSALTVCNNVTVAGTLITGSSMTICGTNVVVQPLQMWPLSGTSLPVRLPSLVARQNFRGDATTLAATINGLVLVGQQFLLDDGPQTAAFNLTGRLVTNEFVLRRRNEWNYSNSNWNLIYSYFTSQLGNSDEIPFFPIFAAFANCNPIPTLTLRAEASSLTDHWQNLANPIYVAHPSDPGLRWDVIRMETGG